MFPTLYLERWIPNRAMWSRVATASTPEQSMELHQQANALSSCGVYWRLMRPSHLADAPPEVVREWSPAVEMDAR